MKHQRLQFGLHALNSLILSLLITASAQADPFDAHFDAPRFLGPVDSLLLGPRVKLQPDGRILIHGQGFNTVRGIHTGPLTRFHPDGTRDAGFALDPDYSNAFSSAPMSNGQVIVSAQLVSYNGSIRDAVLRLNADGSLDNSFNAGAGADGNIRVLTIQPDGRILVGGLFRSFNGSPSQGVVRLNGDGSIDSTFHPLGLGTNLNSVFSPGIWAPMVLQPDGKILLGGVFSTVNGMAYDGLVRLNSNGAVDTSFVPSGYSILNGRPIRGLGFQTNGMLIVGGRLALGASSTRRPLIRLSTNGVADTNFVCGFSGMGNAIRDLKVLPDDRIIAVDDRIYRFNADGVLDAEFTHAMLQDEAGFNFAGLATTLAVQDNGAILVTGSFSFVGDQARQGVARFNPDGSLDTLDLGDLRLTSFPQKIAVQPDGRILISSDFREVNGSARWGLVRLDGSGALDSTFDPANSLGTNAVTTGFALLPDGKIFAFGRDRLSFENWAARLNPDGTLDTKYYLDGAIGGAVSQPDGRILLLADRDAQSLTAAEIRRMDSDGNVENFFDAGQALRDPDTLEVVKIFSPGPRPLLYLPNGNWLLAALTTNRTFSLFQITTNGVRDSGFAAGAIPGATGFTETLQSIDDIYGFHQVPVIEAEQLGFLDAILQPDGKIIVVGQFTNYNGAFAPCIVRLNPNGSIDATFQPGQGPQWLTTTQFTSNYFARIDAVKVLPDGKILVVGNFEAFNGSSFSGVARLNPDGSVDTGFYCGLNRRDFGLYPRMPSRLIPEPDGNFLVTGQFTRGREPDVIRLWRLQIRPTLTIRQLSSDGLQIALSGGADLRYTIQSSSSLLSWQFVTNLTATNVVTVIQDSMTQGTSQKFYRALSP